MISDPNNTLRTIDISWSYLLGDQVDELFKALAKNKKLENLNIGMIRVND